MNLHLTAQNKPKEINQQYQSWISVNTKMDWNNHWSLLADVHIRRNNFISENSFYFIRTALAFNINKNMYVAAGYAHLWLAPTSKEGVTWSNENRIYQQIQSATAVGKIQCLQRLRFEQRWQQKIVNDRYIGEDRFTQRVRYLLSVTIPVFKNEYLPSLVIADELHIQFGKEVLYNTFDQNRVFLGIKQKLGKGWSLDMGYMQVYQQKFSGYQYDLNHTCRLFFYYNGLLMRQGARAL
jgi:hypothetical protein